MSSASLTRAQRAAQEAFKRAVLDDGEAGGYPDAVALLPDEALDPETFARTVGSNIRAGIPVVLVREDGQETMLAPMARSGLPGWIDRRLGRTRIHIEVRGEAKQTAVDQDCMVHLARGDELKQLVTGDLCAI